MSTQTKPGSIGEITFTRLFGSFMRSENCTLVLACDSPLGLAFVGSRDAGKVHFLPTGQPSQHSVAVGRDGGLWSAGKNFLTKWENVTTTGGFKAGGGQLYIPRLRIFTSDIGVRDMAIDGNGAAILASGGYSVVGRAVTDASLHPVWKPPFISRLLREERCGLSGIGLFDQERHCATLWGRSNQANGWRNGFTDGGSVVLLRDSSTICQGLCLPRAPRWRGDDLYLVNAGTAEFGKVDLGTGRFMPICSCPGYPTGLAFSTKWAIISLSAYPPKGTDDLDLPATRDFAERNVVPFSGVVVVDLQTGDIANHAYNDSPDFVVNGVAVLPGTQIAAAVGEESAQLDQLFTVHRPPKGKTPS